MLGLISPQGSEPKAVIEDERPNVPFKKLTVRAYDDENGIFYSASDSGERHLGICAVGPLLLGASSGTVDSMKSLLSHPLPAGSFVQIGRLCSPDIQAIVEEYQAKKTTATSFLREHTHRHAQKFLSGIETPLIKRTGTLLSSQRLIIAVKIPCSADPDEGELKRATEECMRIIEGLKSAGIHVNALTAEGYKALMQRMFKLYDPVEYRYDEDQPIRNQIFSPGDSVKFEKSHIDFNDGDYFAKLMSVKFFPKKASLAVMNYLIGDPLGLDNQITDPYWMVMTIHYPDQVSKKSQVTRKYGFINHQAFGPMARLIPLLGYKKDGFDTLMHELENGGPILIEANLSLFVFGRDVSRLSMSLSKIRSYYASLGFEMREDKRVLEAIFMSTLPLNPTREGFKGTFRTHTMSSSHVAQFLPVIGEWDGTSGDATSLFFTRRGHPAPFSLFASATNKNAVVIAESGAGKSFVVQALTSDLLSEGAKVWVIDSGKSYYKLCRANDGEFMVFNDESQVCLNPFTHVEDIDDDMDILKAILSKMAAPEEGLLDFGMAALEEAIKAVWGNFGQNSTVTAVAEYCTKQTDQRIQDIGKQLYPFTRYGSFGRWFEGANNLDFNKAFVVCELGELKSKPILQKVVLLQLISRINYEMFHTHGRRKVLIVDEAWEQLDDPAMAKALEAVYRKARKHKGSVVIITQGIGDFFNSTNGKAIYQNSAWQLILAQKSEAIDEAVNSKQFTMDPYGIRMLKSLHTVPGKYSEIMIKRSESDWGIVRLVTDRFSEVLFSTTDEERDDILADLDKGIDVVDSINNFIAQNG